MQKSILKIAAVLFAVITVFSVPVLSVSGNLSDGYTVSATAASKKIHLKKTKLTLTTGETYSQKLIDKKGKAISYKKITFKSSNKKIVKVSKKGVVTAVKKGTTTITATYNKKNYKFKVTVKDASLMTKARTLKADETFTQKLYDASGKKISASKITWTSADTKIATVSKKGVVKGISGGKVKITANYKGKKYTFTVTVEKLLPIPKNLIEYMYVGESRQLTLIRATEDTRVSWKSADPEFASVSSSGLVTANYYGGTHIVATITHENETYECNVYIRTEETYVNIDNENTEAKVGDIIYLTTATSPAGEKLILTSSDESVATVDETGKVTVKGYGEAIITAKATLFGKEYTDNCIITVPYERKLLTENTYPTLHSFSKDTTEFQSFTEYADTKFNYGKTTASGITFVKEYTGSGEDFSVIESYVELLTSSGCFSVVKTYKQKVGSFNTRFAYALKYTGNKQTKSFSDTINNQNVDSHLSISGEFSSKIEFTVQWTSSLEAVDMGYRYNSDRVQPLYSSDTAYAGITILEDGTYMTNDGRLGAKKGEACVLRNDEISFQNFNYYKEQRFEIKDYYKDETLYVLLVIENLETGRVFSHDDLSSRIYLSPSVPSAGLKTPYSIEYNQVYTTLGTELNGKWVYPYYNESDYSDAFVKVMYYNEEEGIAVFYIYTDLLEVTEFLCVADLKNAPSLKPEATESASSTGSTSLSGSSSGSVSSPSYTTPDASKLKCTSCHGSGNCSKCGGSGRIWSSAADTNNRNCTSCSANGRCRTCGGDGFR